MTSSASSSSGWRFAAPSSLLLAAVLFFLPWVDIKCQPPARDAQQKPPPAQTLLTQSGLQTVYGGYTMGEMFKAMEQMGNAAGDQGGLKIQPAEQKEKPDVGKAPLMAVYALMVVLGLVLGFVLPVGRQRRSVLLMCCVAAILLLGLQTLLGFPAVRSIQEQNRQQAQVGKAAGQPAAAAQMEPVVYAEYSLWYYLSWVGLVGCLGLVLGEIASGPKDAPRQRLSGPADAASPDNPFA